MVGFPGGSEVKASACKVEDPGSIPGSGRSPGRDNQDHDKPERLGVVLGSSACPCTSVL